jgi:hypothetical protein
MKPFGSSQFERECSFVVKNFFLVPSLLHLLRPNMTKEELMKRQWIGVCVALGFATTAVLGAQDRPSPANTPPPDAAAPPGIQKPATLPAPVQAKGNTVTISGCIQDTPMAIAGAKPGEAAAPGSKTFYLNNAIVAADAGRDRPAVGTSGLASTGYRLDGDTEKLTPHLNHQVRVVGTVQPAAGAKPDAAPMLKVDSVTMVSAKCEPATAAKPE